MLRPPALRSPLLAASLVILAQCTPQRPVQESITLSVNAADVTRKILHSHEMLPVRTGPLTLLYPKWIPGEHGPTGPIIDVAGLKIMGGGKALTWRRDLEEMFAIHCDVPAGVDTLDLSFDYILPSDASGFSSGATSSAELLVLSWNQVVMYPSGPKPDDIIVTPSLRLPPGWKYATALTTRDSTGGVLRFEPVSLTQLVDSPVQSGVHSLRVDLGTVAGAPHHLNVFADNDGELKIAADQVNDYKNLVTEANTLFGAHHYSHYDFLFTLSEHVAHFGLEHHQSSDDRVAGQTFLDNSLRLISADLLPHEFVHSWNGKHRRPAGLATGDFSTPMKGDLLWVYEGLTQYLGKVLAGRAGLWTPEQYREDLAYLAARLDNRPGREWRPLHDTGDEAQLLYYTRADWDSWRRSVDYYDEGDLIWLEADVTIRKLTNGAKTLDDFTKAFHGGESNGPTLRPYSYDDVVSALNGVAVNDWNAFFVARVQNIAPRAPLGGIEGSGWKLSYGEAPTGIQKANDSTSGTADLRYSLGIIVARNGATIDVIPGSPAAKSGMGPGMVIVTVNGQKYSNDVICAAVKHDKGGTAPLQLAVTSSDVKETHVIDYHGGERYPYLERDASKPDVLTAIISPAVKK